jgi:hypothetical protein
MFASPGAEDVTSWSRDGKYLIYNTLSPNGGQELWRITLPEKSAAPLFSTSQSGTGAEMSPDGGWIAFASDETGRNEVWVRGVPPQTEKRRVSNGGGYMARWRADGRELFYIEQPTRRLMAVPVTIGRTLELGTPVALFERPYLLGPSYDATPDGQRFLVRRRGELANHITLIQNWMEVLRKSQSAK